MHEDEIDIKMAARERVISAKFEVDRFRTERNRGDVDPAHAVQHREAEDAAVQELEAAKFDWHGVDPETAPDPKSSPYIYP